jgi:hypothetical protein
MPCGALPSAFKWTEAASITCCNYEASMVWTSDSLCHLTVTSTLETICHRTYVVKYFRPFVVVVNKRSCYWELMREFRFILYTEEEQARLLLLSRHYFADCRIDLINTALGRADLVQTVYLRYHSLQKKKIINLSTYFAFVDYKKARTQPDRITTLL